MNRDVPSSTSGGGWRVVAPSLAGGAVTANDTREPEINPRLRPFVDALADLLLADLLREANKDE